MGWDENENIIWIQCGSGWSVDRNVLSHIVISSFQLWSTCFLRRQTKMFWSLERLWKLDEMEKDGIELLFLHCSLILLSEEGWQNRWIGVHCILQFKKIPILLCHGWTVMVITVTTAIRTRQCQCQSYYASLLSSFSHYPLVELGLKGIDSINMNEAFLKMKNVEGLVIVLPLFISSMIREI